MVLITPKPPGPLFAFVLICLSHSSNSHPTRMVGPELAIGQIANTAVKILEISEDLKRPS